MVVYRSYSLDDKASRMTIEDELLGKLAAIGGIDADMYVSTFEASERID
jgi:hypothetical protein